MKKQFVKQSLIIALIAISGFAFSQETVMLKYNLTKGKTYVQNTEVSQTIVQSMGGQDIKILADIKSVNEINVESIEADGNATILVSFLNASIRSAAMGRDTTMQFNDLKDKSRVVLSAEGKSISSTTVDSSEVSKMLGQLRQSTKLQLLPARPIRIGEKWQDKIVEKINENGFDSNIDNVMDYVLVGKETKDGMECYKITFTGTMAINGKGSQMGMEMFLEGTGKIEGTCYFDPKSTMIVLSESQTEMDMNIAVSGQQNMTIPMTQSMKTIVKIDEKK
ncbi:MAG: hypothetical protein AB9846_15325 [Tenuifilaceae bacterium]